MHLWKEAMLASLRKRWWFLPVSLFLAIAANSLEHRFYEELNRYIDEHIASFLRPWLLFSLSGNFWKSLLLGLVLALVIFAALVVHAYFASTRTNPKAQEKKVPPPLSERARQLARELTVFIEAHPRPNLTGITDLAEVSRLNAPSVQAIHFGYAAHYRSRVDAMLNELASHGIFDVIDDWVINPQVQTDKNIKTNIIDRLHSLADRLDAKSKSEIRPPSRNVGVRDWPGEWLDSESRFRRLEKSGVFAELFSGDWSIRRDRNDDNGSARDEMEAACELAGGRLANSPGLAMSNAVKAQTEHWKRWLQFVKEEQGLNRKFDKSGNGYIEGLARVSAIVCTKCAARAHDS